MFTKTRHIKEMVTSIRSLSSDLNDKVGNDTVEENIFTKINNNRVKQ